jgi:hypothetical protein
MIKRNFRRTRLSAAPMSAPASAPIDLTTALTTEQLAARTGVAAGTLLNWRVRRKAGENVGPKFIKIGGKVRYAIKHIVEWELEIESRAEVA